MVRHLSYSNVLSTVCLFSVLGGGAYAASQIDGKTLKPRSVAAKKLRQNTLTGTEIKERKLKRVPLAQRANQIGSLGAGDVQENLLWARYDYLFATKDGAPPRDYDTAEGLEDQPRVWCAEDYYVADWGPGTEVPNPEAQGCEYLRVIFTAEPERSLRSCAYTATPATPPGARVEHLSAHSAPTNEHEVIVTLELEDGYYDKTSLAPGLSLQVVCPPQ